MGGERRGVEARAGSIRIVFTYRGQRCRETIKIPPTPKNLEYAERKRAQILYEIEIGSFDYGHHFPTSSRAKLGRQRSELTVAKAFDLWMKTRVITATTRKRDQRCYMGLIDSAIGSRTIRSILPSELQQLRGDLAKTRRPKTVNNALIIIRGAFTTAHDDGIINSNPAARLVNIRNPRRSDVDPFTPEELTALGAVLDGQDANMFETWWTTGMRGGELFGLDWADIDWRRLVIHVRGATVEGKAVETKTKDERFVHLAPRAVTALKRQRAFTELAGGKIFHNPETGAAWAHAVSWYGHWKAACKRAKVRFRPPKQLRHTYASMALSAGEPALFVMNQLGHRSLTMLERHYAQWMPKANTDAGIGFDRVSRQV